MNKFICIAIVIFAAIASGSCSGYNSNYGGYNSYNAPGSAAAASSAAATDANNYGAPATYGGSAYGAPAYNSYAAPSYGGYAPAKSYGNKYSYQPAYATELYPNQHHYKQYNSHSTYSQVALPVVQDAPLAKLYTPAAKSYGSYSGY